MVEYTNEMRREYDKQLRLMMRLIIRFPVQFNANGKKGLFR